MQTRYIPLLVATLTLHLVGCDDATEPALDAGQADASAVDGGNADAGEVDGGALDAGGLDAGSTDAGNTDAGNTDAGSADAGNTDAGTTDAGLVDAGALDAGALDAGALDAGPPPVVCSEVPEGTTCAPGRICIASACAVTQCGDGYVDTDASEDCDDGNTDSGDGCDPSCAEERYWDCVGGPSVCSVRTIGQTQTACSPQPSGYTPPSVGGPGELCSFHADCNHGWCIPAGGGAARCAEIAEDSSSCDEPNATASIHELCPGTNMSYCAEAADVAQCPAGDCVPGDTCTRNEDCASGYCYSIIATSSAGICTETCTDFNDCTVSSLNACLVVVNSTTDPTFVCVMP